MSESNNITLTEDGLKKLLSSVVEKIVDKNQVASKSLVSELAEAIIESKKPYVDPKKEENERLMREQSKEQFRRQKENIRFSQDRCSHIQGSHPRSDSAHPQNLSAIAKFKLSTGELIGLCTVCGKTFRPPFMPENPTEEDKAIYERRLQDYRTWVLEKKSANREVGQAGSRYFPNAEKVIREGQTFYD